MTKLFSPFDGAIVPIQTLIQREATSMTPKESKSDGAPFDWLNLRRSEVEDNTFPEPVKFDFRADRYPATLELSEDESFEKSRKYTICEGETAVAENLLSGKKYFWRVNGSKAYSFTTEERAPRWIHVEGCSNVRDIGAWKTVDGRKVKQGLIYRGSEMDTHHSITGEGIRVMREELGIKTDLDLRGEVEGRIHISPLGYDVGFVLIPTKAYIDFMSDSHRETVCRLFEVLAERDNYPIYFHCWGGADRTGTLAFLLGAVLGVSEAELLLDYELTSLSIWGTRSRGSDYFSEFYEELKKYPGESVKEKAESFLVSCGVKEESFAKLRENLLV